MLSLRQQRYPAFEIIVVADGDSLASLETRDLKTVTFDVANLSRARNLGIAQAAGDIFAFIDDDAAAEPLWLHHLAEGFESTSADAAAGFVRGRNGISFQSKALSVDAEAETHFERCAGTTAFVPKLGAARAVKLVGTNMAIRRATLVDIGGFDEAFRFFLEDSDLSMRLAQAGARVAVAPSAQVHHGFAPSSRRTQRRAPLDLFDIGRSTAYYLRRHIGVAGEEFWQRTLRRERARLLKHMVLGTCEPGDVGRRLYSLEEGWREGLTLVKPEPSQPNTKARDFLPTSSIAGEHEVFASQWLSRRRSLQRQAVATVASGNSASVFSFSLTPVRHHVRYTEHGYWLQTGGVFGQSERSGPVFRWCRFAERLAQEIHRVANERGISECVADMRGGQMR